MATINPHTEIEMPDNLKTEVDNWVSDALDALRDNIERSWREKIASDLNTTAQSYDQLLVVTRDGDSITAEITGWLPVAVETGHGPFDLKPFLLQGRNSRVIHLADGNFRTVSVNSPADSWQHPGIHARAFHLQIESEFPELVDKSFTPLFDRIKV